MSVNERGDIEIGASLAIPGAIGIYLLCVIALVAVTVLLKLRDPTTRFFDAAAVKRANLVFGFGPAVAIAAAYMLAVRVSPEAGTPSIGLFAFAYQQALIGLIAGSVALFVPSAARVTQRFLFGLLGFSAGLGSLVGVLAILVGGLDQKAGDAGAGALIGLAAGPLVYLDSLTAFLLATFLLKLRRPETRVFEVPSVGRANLVFGFFPIIAAVAFLLVGVVITRPISLVPVYLTLAIIALTRKAGWALSSAGWRFTLVSEKWSSTESCLRASPPARSFCPSCPSFGFLTGSPRRLRPSRPARTGRLALLGAT